MRLVIALCLVALAPAALSKTPPKASAKAAPAEIYLLCTSKGKVLDQTGAVVNEYDGGEELKVTPKTIYRRDTIKAAYVDMTTANLLDAPAKTRRYEFGPRTIRLYVEGERDTTLSTDTVRSSMKLTNEYIIDRFTGSYSFEGTTVSGRSGDTTRHSEFGSCEKFDPTDTLF